MRDLLSSIFLSPEVSVEIFLEFLLLVVLSYTFLQAIVILKNYKHKATTELQYKLEKKSYLIGVVISISLWIKIILLFFFLYSLDELSLIVPGAMCVSGVINSNDYGEVLLFLKLFILLLSSIWILLNKADLVSLNSQYFKHKMFLFIFIYIFIVLELFLGFEFFSLIETQNPVLCCSSIYDLTQDINPLPFNISKLKLIMLFYILYIAVIFSAYKKQKINLLLLVAAFIYISYYAIVYYFSAYIYELPTHKCPFCMFQYHYNYIGYFIYSSLFMGLFFAFSSFIITLITKNKVEYYFKYSTLFLSIFVSIVTIYVIIYYFKNGVFL